jgi:hypothetical protein
MKNPIPTPLVIAAIAIAVALGGFLIYKGGSGPAEFEAPKTSKIVPQGIWDKMTPSQQAASKAQGYAPGDAKQPSGPVGVPTAPPNRR